MIEVLDNAYQLLNEGLFDNQLPAPNITPTLERKDVLHFSAEEGTLQIGTKFVSARPVEIVDELLHCMVHIYNHQQNIGDVTANQYHRIEFRTGALAVGLIVVCHKTRGWGITHSEPDAVDDKEKVRHPESEVADLRTALYKRLEVSPAEVADYQRELQELLDQKGPTKQFQFKYVCRCKSPIIVRVGRRPDGDKPFLATCGYCNTKFVLDESRPDR